MKFVNQTIWKLAAAASIGDNTLRNILRQEHIRLSIDQVYYRICICMPFLANLFVCSVVCAYCGGSKRRTVAPPPSLSRKQLTWTCPSYHNPCSETCPRNLESSPAISREVSRRLSPEKPGHFRIPWNWRALCSERARFWSREPDFLLSVRFEFNYAAEGRHLLILMCFKFSPDRRRVFL